MAGHRLRHMVVLLPGIGGSVLERNGRDVWAASLGALFGFLKSWGGSLEDLAIDEDDPERPFLDDGVRATRLAQDIHIIPGLAKIDMYTAIAEAVADTFDVIPGTPDVAEPANFIEFPYDWRRDNRANAYRLKSLVDERLPMWRGKARDDDAQVILVVHSMGGLVSRYYLEVLGGWQQCKALVTIGTPHRGSLDALNYLCNGFKKGPFDLSEMMRSFKSVHQLLPIYEAVQVGDGWHRVTETPAPLPGINPAHAEDARRFHDEIKKGVAERPPDAYTLIPIVGTRQATNQSATYQDGKLVVSRKPPAFFPEEYDDGDGTVPRVSATPIELDGKLRETFLPEKHSSLQGNRNILADLEDRLIQMQVPHAAPIQGAGPSSQDRDRPALSLDVGDVYLHGEPVVISAELLGAEVPHLAARLTGPDVRQALELHPDGDRYRAQHDQLAPGTYRVEVTTGRRGPNDPTAVHDVLEVLPP